MWRLSASMVILRRILPKKSSSSSSSSTIDINSSSSSSSTATSRSSYDYEILLQQRGNISHAGMFTFPGGVYEESDGNLMTTALREIFEETGVMFNKSSSISADKIKEWRAQVRENPLTFHNISAYNPDSYTHYCTFKTPDFEKKKYTTLFFLKEAQISDYDHLEADGVETSSLLWIDPARALEANSRGQMIFLPPQFYILSELKNHLKLEEVLTSHSPNSIDKDTTRHPYHPENIDHLIDIRGSPVIKPWLIPTDSQTEMVITLPYDELHPDYPGEIGQRHRIRCKLPMGVNGYELEKTVSSSR